MKVKVSFKNGKTETLNFEDLMIDGDVVDIGLKERMMRPPDKHPVKDASFEMSGIKKIEVLND